MMLDEACRGR